MLSVLIPTYNRECVLLADELSGQIEACGLDAEVVVLDDGSTNMNVLAENAAIDDIPHCRYVVSPKNQGIARSRNRLMDEAKGDFLLFLDSDVWPTNDTFLKKYLEAAEGSDVVVGGLDYRRGEEAVANPLRLSYGISSEVRSVEQRVKEPYAAFISSSFLITRRVSEIVRFDETFDRYGHEDTLFGSALKDAGLSIKHIDNTVFHDVTDSAEQYLSKVRIAIQSLSMHAEQLRGHSRLLSLYYLLLKLRLTKPVYGIFQNFRGPMERHLLGKRPTVAVLSIYKISYLCGVMNL